MRETNVSKPFDNPDLIWKLKQEVDNPAFTKWKKLAY
jgi:hypothetical protein